VSGGGKVLGYAWEAVRNWIRLTEDITLTLPLCLRALKIDPTFVGPESALLTALEKRSSSPDQQPQRVYLFVTDGDVFPLASGCLSKTEPSVCTVI
jgi:hypothetical protein